MEKKKIIADDDMLDNLDLLMNMEVLEQGSDDIDILADLDKNFNGSIKGEEDE